VNWRPRGAADFGTRGADAAWDREITSLWLHVDVRIVGLQMCILGACRSYPYRLFDRVLKPRDTLKVKKLTRPGGDTEKSAEALAAFD
jgi:hypothetical protein